SSPSRRVITNACSMASLRNEIQSQEVYPDHFGRINRGKVRRRIRRAAQKGRLQPAPMSPTSAPGVGRRGDRPEKDRPLTDAGSLLWLPTPEVERVRDDAGAAPQFLHQLGRQARGDR